MNEKDQKPDRHEREQQRESDREERHEARAIVFRAATDRPQHDKAVGENCHEHAEHELIGPIAHEIAQDARGVLRRGERERDDGDRESDPSHGNHRTSDGSEHAARAFRTGIEQGLPAFCGERFGENDIELDEPEREHDSGEDEQRRHEPERGADFDPKFAEHGRKGAPTRDASHVLAAERIVCSRGC